MAWERPGAWDKAWERFQLEFHTVKTDHDKGGSDTLFLRGTAHLSTRGISEQIKTRPGDATSTHTSAPALLGTREKE